MAAEDKDLNRDPITDEPGAHPVGTGVGAAGGAVAGAAAGTVAGPVGTMVGGVIGAVVGGLAGKAAAEAINPTAEEEHWRENYTREPYYEQGRSFDEYRPAYLHGVHGRMQHEGDWDTAEPRLASEWENARSGSGLTWEQARPASRAAWDRVDQQRGGGASGMGLGSRASGADTAMVRSQDLAGTNMGGDDSMSRSGMGASMGSSMGSVTGTGMGASMAGTDLAGSSRGMDQDVGGGSSDAGMGRTGMESGSGRSMGAGSGMDAGSSKGTGSSLGAGSGMGAGAGQNTGAAGMVGAAQSAGNMTGERNDVVDALQDLVECCKDGAYGFRECAEQAKDAQLKSMLLQRADDCRRGAEELNQQIRQCGGQAQESGSAMGALHRGWVSVRSALTAYDDKAVLEECERGEDNALARYRKALQQPLPPQVKQVVERQYQQVQRNHDQVKMLRNQLRGQ